MVVSLINVCIATLSVSQKSFSRYTPHIFVVRLIVVVRAAIVEVHVVRVGTVILRRRPVVVRLKMNLPY